MRAAEQVLAGLLLAEERGERCVGPALKPSRWVLTHSIVRPFRK
jgi:hypothetical protein